MLTIFEELVSVAICSRSNLRSTGLLPESRQLFEAAAARASGLVNLVFSRQTGFSSASVRLVTKPMVLIEPVVPWLGFETVSWQHAAHIQ